MDLRRVRSHNAAERGCDSEPRDAAAARPLEEIENEITTLAAHLGAAEHRLLTAIGEFDVRGGWVGIGIASCAHWLNWKCGISLVAAHDKVRVARALRGLPEISSAMARGQLSYSKVRALTRVATPANEPALVRLAQQGTASHVEEIVRRYRRIRRLDDAAEAAKSQRARELRYRWDDDGTLVLHARLPAEQGAIVLHALQAAAEALRQNERREEGETAATKANESSAEDRVTSASAYASRHESSAQDSAPGHEARESRTGGPSAHDSSAEESRVGYALCSPGDCFAARRADALVVMGETLLRHGPAELCAAERHQVVVHVDFQALSGARQEGRCEIEQGPPLSLETVRRLLCDASIVPLREDQAGNPLDIGRKTRAIPPAIRRALNARDQGCRFPGCSHKRYTDAHHIQHWTDGGETKLTNLVRLCRVHHRLVHDEGFTIEQTGTGLVFRTPDGRRVEDAPAAQVLAHDPVLALMSTQRDRAITSRTCIPEWMGEVPAYDWITDALFRRDERARANAGLVARDRTR